MGAERAGAAARRIEARERNMVSVERTIGVRLCGFRQIAEVRRNERSEQRMEGDICTFQESVK